jgi:hypothetical protein
LSRRRVPALSDEDWQAALKAAAPLSKGAKLEAARRALTACLRDYQGLRISRDALRDAQAILQRIDRRVTDLRDDLAALKRVSKSPHVDDVLGSLEQSGKAIVDMLDMLSRSRATKLVPEKGWLYLALFEVWTDLLGGELRASTTSSGGPCVRFIRAAMALVFDDVPKVGTVRAVIKAYRSGKGVGMFRPVAMKKCRHCGHENSAGEIVRIVGARRIVKKREHCERCGKKM